MSEIGTPLPPSPDGLSPPGYRPQLKLAPRELDRKERVIDAALNARAVAAELVESFRASDRFFKYKASVLAAWLVLSIATFVFACPSVDVGPSNSLSAGVRLDKVTVLDTPALLVSVENHGAGTWNDVTLTLDGVYTAALLAVPGQGGKAVVAVKKFSGNDGKSPPAEYVPRKLRIRCSEGDSTFDLSESR